MSMNSNKSHKILPYIKTKSVVNSAKDRVAKEKSGLQYGVKSRYPALNRAMLRFFRFAKVVLLAGMSGSGKSYFLNFLRNDFLMYQNVNFGQVDFNLGEKTFDLELIDGIYQIPRHTDDFDVAGKLYVESGLIKTNSNEIIMQAINRKCEYDVVLVHFGYEMDAEDELIRTAANFMGRSYGYLMSSEYSLDSEIQRHVRNTLTDAEYSDVCKVFDALGQRKEYYVPTSGNVEQLKVTCYDIAAKNPNAKLIITIDHSLLSKRLKEKSDGELQQSVAIAAVELRQRLGALVIILAQLNQNIQSVERVNNAAAHYPIDTDIHHGGQLRWACDTVIINHRPSVLGIKKYGKKGLNTSHLIHGAIVKNRSGRIGNIFFKEDFAHGRILPAKESDFLP